MVDSVQQVQRCKLDAWVAFVYAHARLMDTLGAELDTAAHMPLTTYDILVQLSEAGGSLRHRDLLRHLTVSQPGLSRRVDRLVGSGLVERRPDPRDGRGVIIRLTRTGRAALRSAAKVHMAGIDRVFGAHVTDAEAEVLRGVFNRMLQAQADEHPDS